MQSFIILERDDNADVLVTFRYPNVSVEDEQVLIARSLLEGEELPDTFFSFSKFRGRWYYSWTIATPQGGTLGRVRAFTVALVCTDYHPESYGSLGRLLGKQYSSGASPVQLMQTFLSALTLGKAEVADFPAWEAAAFNIKACYLGGSLRLLHESAGAEGVGLLYAAMLTKKRVAVSGGSLARMQMAVRTLPLLVWHRQAWDLMRPLVTGSELEMKELREAGVWCAGLAGAAKSMSGWDVMLDLDQGRVLVSDEARESLAGAGELARGVANAVAAGGEDDQATLKAVVQRTQTQRDKLAALGNPKVTLAALQALEGLPPHLDRFLYSFAQAEGMTE